VETLSHGLYIAGANVNLYELTLEHKEKYAWFVEVGLIGSWQCLTM
jgi:hypothetical protein